MPSPVCLTKLVIWTAPPRAPTDGVPVSTKLSDALYGIERIEPVLKPGYAFDGPCACSRALPDARAP